MTFSDTQVSFDAQGIGFPPIDFRRLDYVAETDHEKMALLKIFFKTTTEIVSELKLTLSDGDRTGWNEASHKLRGVAGNLGMKPLEQLCLKSEKIAAWNTRTAQEFLKQIEDETTRIKTYIASSSLSK